MQNVNSIQLEDPTNGANFISLEKGVVSPAVLLVISREISPLFSIKIGPELSHSIYKVEIEDTTIEVTDLQRSLILVPLLAKLRFLPAKSWHLKNCLELDLRAG